MCVNLHPNYNFLYRMRRLFFVLSLLIATTCVLTSCLGSDDNEVTLSDDAAITSFSLGTLYRYYHPASNPDTTIKAVVTGSNYPMTIDHLGQRIFNRDSLPSGTVPRVLCSIGTKNGGYVGYQALPNDTTFYLYSTSDSVDFSNPRVFRVASSDGTYYRDYTVMLNISKNTGETFGWQKTDSVGLLAGLDGFRPIVVNGKLFVFGKLNGNTVATAKGTDGTWGVLSSNVNTLFTPDAWQNIAVKDGYVYLFSSPTLFRSKDGEQWEEAASAASMGQVKQLLGAASHELFALGTDGRIKVSRDDGATWIDERLDEEASLLPVGKIAFASFPLATSWAADYVLLAGASTNAADTTCNVWRKLSYFDETPDQSQWVYVPTKENEKQLPVMENLSIAYFQGCLLATGSKKGFCESHDQGITWYWNYTYSMPKNTVGERFAIAADGEEALWIVTNTGQVWSGRKY